MLRGIDVSAHQGAIEWDLVADAGISFAWIRATCGLSVDNRFVANWAGALYLGELPRGAYHFFTVASAAKQADHFLRHYPGAGELPPVLDMEHGLDGSAPSPADALIWIEIVYRELGVRPAVYCSPAYAEAHRFAAHPELAASDLWVAHYDVPAPRVPRPWTSWRAWQHGVDRVPGIGRPVDLNVMQPTP